MELKRYTSQFKETGRLMMDFANHLEQEFDMTKEFSRDEIMNLFKKYEVRVHTKSHFICHP